MVSGSSAWCNFAVPRSGDSEVKSFLSRFGRSETALSPFLLPSRAVTETR